MEPVFIKKEDQVLFLVSGNKDKPDEYIEEGYVIMDSIMAEGAREKHLPVVEKIGKKITVNVGSMAHPMTAEHSIDWIFLETKQGGQFRQFRADEKPKGEFILADGDEAVAAYAYCNLHGFWKTEII